MNELLIAENGLITSETSEKIKTLVKTIKELKETEETLRASLLTEMESRGILKLEDDNVSITYKAAYDKESFDSKQFMIEHADLYDQYVKISTCKPSLLIKVK